MLWGISLKRNTLFNLSLPFPEDNISNCFSAVMCMHMQNIFLMSRPTSVNMVLIKWASRPGRGRWGLDMTERLHFHFSLSCIGEGNGNPLQCSCLENPRDGGAWWAAIYGVAQSRIRLKRLSSSSSSRSSMRYMIEEGIESQESGRTGSDILCKIRRPTRWYVPSLRPWGMYWWEGKVGASEGRCW